MELVLPILAGPTASGKTALAVRLGLAMGLEVISADATMVYRGLDVGTDKPSSSELRGVPHHLIDVVEPDQSFDMRQFVERAEACITAVLKRGRLPLIVGGTGFYIRSLSEGFYELQPADPVVQKRLWLELEEKGLEVLQGELRRASPQDAARVGRNPRRVVRALEVLRVSGRPPIKAKRRFPRFAYRKLVLWPKWQELRPRIAGRAEAQFANGLVEEVRGLLERYPVMPTALQTIGYKEVARYLQGRYSLDEALSADRAAVLAYARRQYTWFRREPGHVTYLPTGWEAAWTGLVSWFDYHWADFPAPGAGGIPHP